MLGEDLEGEIVERGGEERVEEGEERRELCLVLEFLGCGMGLGEVFCLSKCCLWDCLLTDGDFDLSFC